MTSESEALDATLELVRAADPLSHEWEHPDTEAALRVLLATVPVARTRKAPRRRGLTLGGLSATATVATVVALNIAPSGGGEMAKVLDQAGVLVSPARAAQIIARVQHQLTHFAPNEIIEFRVVSHQTGPRGFVSTWSQSQWESTSSPYRELVTWTSSWKQGKPWHYSEGTTRQDINQIYDPSRNTIYEPTAKPAWKLTPGARAGTWTLTVPRAVVYTQLARRLPAALRGTEQLTISASQARALRSGVKQVVYAHPYRSTKRFSIFTQPRIGTYPNVTGYRRPEVPATWVSGLKTRGVRVRLHGQSAIEITSKATSTTYWFSATTLYPLKSVTRLHPAPSSVSPSSVSGANVLTSRFTVYKVLRGKAASSSLLSLRHAHPTASIVVGERAYDTALIRLGAG